MEANSGAVFMRKLALKMDPVNAPKLSLFAWNLGTRGEYPAYPRRITDILTKIELLSLAAVYFEKCHPILGFLDREVFMYNLEKRWLPGQMETPHSFDPVLCGVAILGYRFSYLRPEPKELELAKAAAILLEQSAASTTASMDTVIGSMLRVLYLRLTASPHVTWMASCALMHMIEAAGLNSEPSPTSVLHRPADECDPEFRRRLFGVAQHFNIWISYDMGRSRVALRGTDTLPPSPRQGDITTQLLDFLPLAEGLDPDKNPDSVELEAALSSVLDTVPSHAASILTQCNLVLCMYRRLRVLNHNISGHLLDRVLATCARSIHCAREMLDNMCPWHHVAYVPFQVICALLAMDTRASLGQIGSAMETLAAVTSVYNSDSMKEAYSTARLLVLLQQKRKEEDAKILTGVLRLPSQTQPQPKANGDPSTTMPPVGADTVADFSWLDDLAVDMPYMQDFDWNQFLNDDGSWYMAMPNA